MFAGMLVLCVCYAASGASLWEALREQGNVELVLRFGFSRVAELDAEAKHANRCDDEAEVEEDILQRKVGTKQKLRVANCSDVSACTDDACHGAE